MYGTPHSGRGCSGSLSISTSSPPRIANAQLEQEKVAVAFELEDMLMRPDPQPLLEELIYQVCSCGEV